MAHGGLGAGSHGNAGAGSCHDRGLTRDVQEVKFGDYRNTDPPPGQSLIRIHWKGEREGERKRREEKRGRVQLGVLSLKRYGLSH